MEKIMELKCTNGILYVYEDRVVISRKTVAGFISQGIKGEKTLYYNDLTSIEYKKPSIWANGYIKFIVPGSKESNQSVTILGTTKEAMQDPNSLILRAFNKKIPEESERIYKFIIQKIKDSKINKVDNTKNNINSTADEILKYKHLFDEGIITKEEFEKKKQELLK